MGFREKQTQASDTPPNAASLCIQYKMSRDILLAPPRLAAILPCAAQFH